MFASHVEAPGWLFCQGSLPCRLSIQLILLPDDGKNTKKNITRFPDADLLRASVILNLLKQIIDGFTGIFLAALRFLGAGAAVETLDPPLLNSLYSCSTPKVTLAPLATLQAAALCEFKPVKEGLEKRR